MMIKRNNVNYLMFGVDKYQCEECKKSIYCPVCGHRLCSIKKSNVMVCDNPLCSNMTFELT